MDKKTTYFQLAAEQARKATCLRARCGSVIIAENGSVIGEGSNAPPRNDENNRYCATQFDTSKKPKYDVTCCVHAEWNAIFDMLKRHPDKADGATLYFMRVDENGNFTGAGVPYCTVCSRLALQSGIQYFALWHDGDEKRYNTTQYNKESYAFYNPKEET